MKKVKKIKLESLKVKSFTTKIEKENHFLLKGGKCTPTWQYECLFTL